MSNTLTMQTGPLGSQGLVCGQQGLGCMTMTAFYGKFNRKESEIQSIEAIGKALEMGVNMLGNTTTEPLLHHTHLYNNFQDTAWIYQSFGSDGEENTTNEELVGKAMKKYGREKFILATKCGISFGPDGPVRLANEAFIRAQLADSLQRLDTDYIDLYYVHRMPSDVSIEEMMDTMKKLVNEGKIKYVGLSECTPDELRRAHKVFPVSAIQMEWSLQSRDIEESVVPTARELGIGIVAYSPLGRGLLSHTFTKREDLDEKDWRLSNPRFSEENFNDNAKCIENFNGIAERLGVTYAQLALAWVHAQGDDVFPIPGTKTPSRAVENAKAYEISKSLSPDVVAEIKKSVGALKGDRYPNKDGQWNTRV